jgi:hypothetical protein
MLLAEIHGKRCLAAETNEDWLTSAVFGHLRSIPPRIFWTELFRRALSATDKPIDLTSELSRNGIVLQKYDSLSVLFWKGCGRYGEPDLLLRFTGAACIPIVVLIEVKLHASKSGVGKDDQLAKYLDLLDDSSALPEWSNNGEIRVVVYLTKAYAATEIRDSVSVSRSHRADTRIFGLQWQDVLEVASATKQDNAVLREVAAFLRGRGFEAFRGFERVPTSDTNYDGHFYSSTYFKQGILAAQLAVKQTGAFYE